MLSPNQLFNGKNAVFLVTCICQYILICLFQNNKKSASCGFNLNYFYNNTDRMRWTHLAQ